MLIGHRHFEFKQSITSALPHTQQSAVQRVLLIRTRLGGVAPSYAKCQHALWLREWGATRYENTLEDGKVCLR